MQEDSRAVRVLIVSNNLEFEQQLRARLEPLRWITAHAGSGAEALEMLHLRLGTEVLLLDPALPDLLPGEFRSMVRRGFPEIEVLNMDTTRCQVLPEPLRSTPSSIRLASLLRQEENNSQSVALARPPLYTRTPANGPRFRGILGESLAMERVYSLMDKVAGRDTTVLITGESGTGKDLVAQAIHQVSPRRQSPLVVVNCAAIPEALLESELFGYAKGAFTGAMQSRIGRIHAAQGGTLFLDEIGDMPLVLQSKILRFVEQGEVQRLGSNDNMRVDVRVVAATNANLADLVKQKLFREDLYFRLAIFPIKLAPLRERGRDIEILARFFANKFCAGISVTDQAVEVLAAHPWPGNVRELRNVMERACIMARSENELTAEDIHF